MVGKKYGRLLVTKYLGNYITNKKAYTHVLEAICDCGKIDVYRAASIKFGNTVSCGCYAKEMTSKTHKKHGHASGYIQTGTYRSWFAMKARCYKKNSNYYYCYGAIGVTVCDRWINSFENFLADMGERPKGKTLDRFPDKKGNYEPSNCRWATPSEQMRNFSRNKFYLYNGENVCVSDLEKIAVVSSKTIRHRINNLGWSVEDAISKPPLKGRQTYKKIYNS